MRKFVVALLVLVALFTFIRDFPSATTSESVKQASMTSVPQLK
jgi:hypothetical protein